MENPEAPTFENTIVALDNSGEILSRVSGVFFALTSADTNDELMALESKIAPMLSEHSDNIYLNEALYQRVGQGLRTGKIRCYPTDNRTALLAGEIPQGVRTLGCCSR